MTRFSIGQRVEHTSTLEGIIKSIHTNIEETYYYVLFDSLASPFISKMLCSEEDLIACPVDMDFIKSRLIAVA